MGQSKGKYVYFIFQQEKKVITWVAYVSWASSCCLGEYSWSRPDGFAASKNPSWFSLLSLYLVSSFLRHWILSSRAHVSCRLPCVSCLRYFLLELVSLVCLSQDRLLFVRARTTWGQPGSPAALKGARLQTQGARWSRKYYVLCQKESITCMNTFTSTGRYWETLFTSSLN